MHSSLEDGNNIKCPQIPFMRRFLVIIYSALAERDDGLSTRDDLPGFPLAIHVYPDDDHGRRAGKVDLSASGALLTRLKFCIAFETSC